MIENGARVDLPVDPNEPKSATELAAEMTDVEHKAMTIMNFRMLQEILEFVRDAKEGLASMSENGGMMGRMLSGMMPPALNGKPVMPPGMVPPPGFRR